MKVELTIAEAVKLANTFKDLYHYATLPREMDKRVKSEYTNLIRKIEEVETALIIEREKHLQKFLEMHEKEGNNYASSYEKLYDR